MRKLCEMVVLLLCSHTKHSVASNEKKKKYDNQTENEKRNNIKNSEDYDFI